MVKFAKHIMGIRLVTVVRMFLMYFVIDSLYP